MAKKSPSPIPKTSTITVIGPRSSGKTTYLAGLALFPQSKFQKDGNRTKFDVIADEDNRNSRELQQKAKSILIEGHSLKPTDELIKYSFRIEVTHNGKPTIIFLEATDFPGEGLDTINIPGSKYRGILEAQLSDQFNSFLILLSHWTPPESDNKLTVMIQTFKEIVKTKVNPDDLKSCRLAVVMNKCEQGELWPSRLDPKRDLFDRYLHYTTRELQRFLNDFGISQQNLEFFAMSTFGVIDQRDPRPNRKQELSSSVDPEDISSVLRFPDKWRPYGMISPIYWLATGERLHPSD
jgi:hypothetical protein